MPLFNKQIFANSDMLPNISLVGGQSWSGYITSVKHELYIHLWLTNHQQIPRIFSTVTQTYTHISYIYYAQKWRYTV